MTQAQAAQTGKTAKPPTPKTDARYCMTPEFRVSYPHVFKPHSGFEGQEPKFSIVMLFDKATDIKPLKAAAHAAAVEKWGPKEKWPKKLRLPFRDGDEERSDSAGYANTVFVQASSKQRPGVIDNQMRVLAETDNQFYAGCYARATIQAFAYDTAANKGISFGLRNVQKLRNGEHFSGFKRAEDEFEAVEDSSEDASNYNNGSAAEDDENDFGL